MDDEQFPPDMPEEIREAIRASIRENERHRAAAEEYRHKVMRLFDELNKEQVMTLRHILNTLAQEETGRLASYYEGQLTTIGSLKYNICGGCGTDHDEEAAHMMKEAVEEYERDQAAAETPDGTRPDLEQMFEAPDAEEPDQAVLQESEHVELINGEPTVNEFHDLTQTDLDNMKTYHLDDARADGNDDFPYGYLLGFICTGIVGGPRGGCGQIYPTIADRMLRPSEECSGCFTKAAHG